MRMGNKKKAVARWTLNLVLYFDFPIGWFWIDNINSVRFVRWCNSLAMYCIRFPMNVLCVALFRIVVYVCMLEKWITIEFQWNRISQFIFNMCRCHSRMSERASLPTVLWLLWISVYCRIVISIHRKVWCVYKWMVWSINRIRFHFNLPLSLIDYEISTWAEEFFNHIRIRSESNLA